MTEQQNVSTGDQPARVGSPAWTDDGQGETGPSTPAWLVDVDDDDLDDVAWQAIVRGEPAADR